MTRPILKNSIKAVIKFEDGAEHTITGKRYRKEHALIIYRMLLGGFNPDQLTRIGKIIDEKHEDKERR